MHRIIRHRLNFFKAHRVLSALLLVVLVIAALELTNVTHFFHQRPQTTQVVVAGTPIQAPKNTSKATPGKPISNTSGSRNSGGATDTHGSVTPQTASNQWVTSASGYITVKQPTANSKLQSGDTISGTAKVDKIHYRLKDNKVGQVAEGTLSVVDGKFSGTLHFTPQGTGGRLDIFSTDTQGVEYNEIQINVVF